MKSLKLTDYSEEIRGIVYLRNINLEIEKGADWVFLGANGSGKSRLGQLIGRLWPGKCGYVSFEKEREIIDRERREDESDILDRPDPGRSASRFILERNGTEQEMAGLAERFRFTDLLDRGLKYLSTGELRKVLIAEELMSHPDLMILDEPYEGLDVDSRHDLSQLINQLMEQGIQIILLLNRFSEIPDSIENLGYMQDRTLVLRGDREFILRSEELWRLHHFQGESVPPLPSTPRSDDGLYGGPLLVNMKNIRVAYDGREVIKNLDWTVLRGQHWKIVGPNGVGKSTLLSLITGDNPQAYANDISLFGMKKGSGETVWDIKKHIGYVSSSLQREYRVRTSVKLVIISGFYDSIGVYQHYSESEAGLAEQWLRLIKMENKADRPFQSLSFGEQRLVLIARAMVKHPPLLILDEPCQGLDEVNRLMILKLIDILGNKGETTLLYVTHHSEDKIPSIRRELRMDYGGKTFEIELKES
ncbi:molybdate ABC transporter ATP-binding protein ModF [Spirochaeta isovalerica]|uniref:Molybdate transport system ATP-binding protein n=1 Tax=Spirochaeta isovalerica TaxID=150 RepID=A0A841REF0_9SPIO|nr:molybdate transport system ATP-binding protein [Spirochaeta isovalerica]